MVRYKEDDRLIEGEERKTKLWRNQRLIVLICVCIITICIIISIAVIVAKTHRIKSGHDKNKFVISKNLTVADLLSRNDKLCKSLTNKSNAEEKYEHIYIVKVDLNLTDKQACGIESVLRLFPDKTIYLIDFNKHENLDFNRCSSPPNYLGLLIYLYKDRLQIIFAEIGNFFKDTPLLQFSPKNDRFEFLAILLTAYKYGGFVMSPNAVIKSRDLVECLPEETVVEPFAILSPKICDEFLHYLIESFSFCGPEYSMPLDEMLTKSVELYARTPNYAGVARRLRGHEVCLSLSHKNSACSFQTLKMINGEDSKWVCELSLFCKQVVQALLGIKINQMEVEEETSKIKYRIASKNVTCKAHHHSSLLNNTC